MAKDSYKKWPYNNAVNDTDFEAYKTLNNTASDYYGAIYIDKKTDELVVAHPGTEFDDNGTGTDMSGRIETGGQMTLGYIKKNRTNSGSVASFWKLNLPLFYCS